jgi:hypothetical protein
VVGLGLGVNVEGVIPNSAADGVLAEGDLLTTIDGGSISDADQLRAELAKKSVGDQIDVVVVRDGEDLSNEVLLGANPDDPSRPMLGIMAETAYRRVEPSELRGEPPTGEHTRPVDVAGRMYLLDPEDGSWAPLRIDAPEGNWVGVPAGIFILENASTAESSLVDVGQGIRVEFDLGGWRAAALLGTFDGRVLVSAVRPLTSDPELVEVSVILVDLATKEGVWIWQVTEEGIGVPVAAFPSPSADRIMVAARDQETDIVRYLILSSEGQLMVPSDELAPADDTLGLGWFDDNRFLALRPSGEVIFLEATLGGSSIVNLPDSVTAVDRLWAVGNGRHVIFDNGATLARADLTQDVEVRALVERCVVGRVGDPGWRTG